MPLEDQFIYRPGYIRDLKTSGNDLQLTASDGVLLHARYHLRAYAYFNLLYLHGSRGSLAVRGDALKTLTMPGPNLLALDYRGYGRSEGDPSEEGLYRDAAAAYDWLTARAPAASVIVLGEGLGSGPACELASTRPIGALILVSAFTSLAELAAARYPYLPTSWIVRSRFDNLAKLPNVSAPKLIIHSRTDERVPFEMGERLYAAATEPKAALWLPDTQHDQLYTEAARDVTAAIATFVNALPTR